MKKPKTKLRKDPGFSKRLGENKKFVSAVPHKDLHVIESFLIDLLDERCVDLENDVRKLKRKYNKLWVGTIISNLGIVVLASIVENTLKENSKINITERCDNE